MILSWFFTITLIAIAPQTGEVPIPASRMYAVIRQSEKTFEDCEWARTHVHVQTAMHVTISDCQLGTR